MEAVQTSSQEAANQYRQAQQKFMGLYQEYLINEGVKIAPESAQAAT